MKLHFTRLGAISSEWLDIQSFSTAYHPDYDSKWVKVKHMDGEEELVCPVSSLWGCYMDK